MRTITLLKRNLTYYWRTNLAVVLGVGTAVAVLAGALLVGDSVRASLRDLVLLRLGRADLIIASTGFFREQLADDLQAHSGFASAFNAACPMIVLEGVVTHDESGRRGSGIQVYGVDERFWRFHGRERVQAPGGDELMISASLAEELGSKKDDALVVRIEKPSAIPVESLHGRKDDLGRTIRGTLREALPAAGLGEFALRPQQSAVRAVFVPLQRLQKSLEQGSKVNTILLSAKDAGNDRPSASPLAGKILKEAFTLADVGLKLRVLETPHAISLESDSALINDALAETARAAAGKLSLRAAPILTYLANTIRFGEREIPYSLVTALEAEDLRRLISGGALPREVSPSSIILNDWAARDLGVKPGDEVTLDYYVWQEEGRLITQSAQFRVAEIVPLQGLAADRDFAPEYPGITESDSLSDWDPPFPMDLNRVRQRDEDYWHQYRTTPKAFVLLDAGQKLWSSRYGNLTSLRIIPADGSDLQNTRRDYEQSLRAALDPTQLGLAINATRDEGLAASRGATDFGEYFTYFSFFLVISALLLTGLFFKLGVEQRLREVGLLRAVGFPAAKIRALFLSEGAVLALAGSMVGVAGALAYGGLMMIGLRTWWVGAVGTTQLALHPSATSLLLGAAGGVLAAFVCIVWTLRALAPVSPRSLLAGVWENESGRAGERESGRAREGGTDSPSRRAAASLRRLFSRSPALPLVLSLLGLALLLAASLGWIGQVAGFFGAGTLLLIALLGFQLVWLRRGRRNTLQGAGWWPVSRLGFRNASYRPGRSVLCIALIAAATFIIVAVDAFRRDSRATTLDRKSGSGGYPLLAESLLPLLHDPSTAEGRDNLNLPALDDPALSQVTFARFRVRPGDDASCLNLYQPRHPRILAPLADFVRSGRFAFQDSLATSQEEKANPWLLLETESADGAVPVIADANSLTYALHLKLGDELFVSGSDGQPVKLRLVGALADSIFQSELLMSEKNFLRLFPGEEGYRFFLLDVAPERAAAVTGLLEDRLSDFGFDVMPTGERLAGFHRVENTYLSTFQTLGGLGLVLGTLGLATVLLRNVLERRRELALLRAVGYNSSHFALMVIAENALLLVCGLATGTVCALLAIAPAFFARGGHLPTVSLGLLLLAVLVTGLVASVFATVAVLRSPLLPALRAE
jgi:ABC-type lipoprotein release transport system permease subunit